MPREFTKHIANAPGHWRHGFTLGELMVVIAIIALLAAFLLPALSRAKRQAQSLACLNNLKQLELSCHLYTVDNQDFLVPNQAGGFVTQAKSTNGPASVANPDSWCPGLASYDATPTNVTIGLIFPYNHSTPIYHCPSDQSTVVDDPLLLRTRSYCLDICLNCDQALHPYHKFTELLQPSPSDTFALIDTQEEDIFDATFGIFSPESHWSDFWLDLPADRHSQGANLSFADGHVEHWRWQAPKIFEGVFWPAMPPEDLNDLHRLQACMRPGGN